MLHLRRTQITVNHRFTLVPFDNGDISSLVGTWTNANGESVTINADGTIIKNSTGYNAQLKPPKSFRQYFFMQEYSQIQAQLH